MTTQTIDTPVLSGSALRSINFFNGRLLTGDDLSSEQGTQLARAQRLGRAVGDGVAYGLEVSSRAGSSPGRPVVTVAAGVALSRSGLALELTSAVDVSIARAAAATGSEPGGLFADCQPFAAGTYTAGAGVYLLSIGPAHQGDGLAAVNGLGNASSPCNVATEIQTVKFRLIRLALNAADLAERNKLRNHLAYLCFAPAALDGFTADPFGAPPATYGLIDELRVETLSDDEVPLATIGWAIDTGISFVDLWSVRRRITRRPAEDTFAPFAGDRRRAEGEAMFLQFQGEVDDRLFDQPARTLVARDSFGWLPAAGVLPVAARAGAPGISYLTFFSGMTVRPAVGIEGPRVGSLVRSSFHFPPISTSSQELVWLYVVRENMQAASKGGASEYLLFARGDMPFVGDPHFDVAHWNFANYQLLVS